LREGSRLDIGGKPFTVRGRIVSEPDRLGVRLALGPRLLVSRATLATTGLDTFGSRGDPKVLIKIPDNARPHEAGALVNTLETGGSDGDAEPGLRDRFKNATRFLGLVALVSLVLGGIGVAETVRAWLASRLD